MKKVTTVIAVVAAPLVALAGLGACSNDADNCERHNSCGTGATTSSNGGGGAGGGVNPGCVPSALPVNTPVPETCSGVFVSSSVGNDANVGTEAAPVATLSHAVALARAAHVPVYACGESFTEAATLDVPAGTVIFGALTCASGWAYDPSTKSHLTGPADTPAALLAGGNGATSIEDFILEAPAAMVLGASSIAAIANGGSVALARVELIANAAQPGDNGQTPTDDIGPASASDPAVKGNDGKAACLDTSAQTGGGAKDNAFCPSANGGPLGGSGGNGAVTNGSNGDIIPANGTTALGGTGEPAGGGLNCTAGQGGGTTGNPGTQAPAGNGGAGKGSLSAAGYVGVDGDIATRGTHGQGGGGGGGAKGKVSCAGASGGGGGTGGCGGFGGSGGKAGGSSIALVSLGATLNFTDVMLTAGAGGKGGDGGDGQGGANGGIGGLGGNGSAVAPATLTACDGGHGGQGGAGGKGGGGAGGHSLGIAFTGPAPDTAAVTFNLGTLGPGGAGAGANGNGAAGQSVNALDFTN